MKSDEIVDTVKTSLNFPGSEIDAVIVKTKKGTLFTFFNDNGETHVPLITLLGEKPGTGELIFAMLEADIRKKASRNEV